MTPPPHAPVVDPAEGTADLPLSHAERGLPLQIRRLVAQPNFGELDGAIEQRLRALGFVPGARIEVLVHGPWGGDPLAVRVAGTCFALRRAEADKIRVGRLV